MSYNKDYKPTLQKVTDFLFDRFETGKETDGFKNIDTRTDVTSKEIFSTLMFYRILQQIGSKSAKEIANTLEKLLISIERKGRLEGVEVMKRREFPKVERMWTSSEDFGEHSTDNTD